MRTHSIVFRGLGSLSAPDDSGAGLIGETQSSGEASQLGEHRLDGDTTSGLSNPPSVAAVTTTIFVVQTIIGLLGSWVAGTQAKSIIMGPRRGMPSGPSDRYSSTGLPEVRATSAMIRMKGDHHPRTPSCFTVAARLQYPNAIQLRAWKKPPASDPPARRPCFLPLLKSHGCCSLW